MSRSRHGHKHVARSKCWVCMGRDRARKTRETEQGKQDREQGEQEHDSAREELE